MTLKKYGSVFIGIGLITGGAYIWDSYNPRVAAESEAALFSSTIEHEEIPYLFGSDQPDFLTTTNIFGPRKQWDIIYGRTLEGARFLVTNNVSLQVYWIDPNVDITNGMTLVESGGTWISTQSTVDTNDFNLTFTGATNASATVHSSGSHYPETESVYMPDVSTNNAAPIIDEFYDDDAEYDLTKTLFSGTNNWWRYFGIDTNVYKYWCEEWREPGRSTYAVSQYGEYSMQFSFSPLKLSTKNSIPLSEILTTVSTNGSTNISFAAMYKIESDFANDFVYGVVSDVGDITLEYLEINPQKITVEEGVSKSVGVRLSRGDFYGSFAYVNITSESTGNILASDSFRWAADGEGFGEIEWDTWQYFVITDPADNNDVDDVGIIRAQTNMRIGSVHYSNLTYFPVKEIDAEGPSAGLSVNSIITDVVKGGSENIVVTDAYTNDLGTTLHLNQRVSTNNVFEAKAVLDSLTRTMVVFDYNDVNYTSVVHSTYTFYDGATTNGYGDASADGTYQFADALAAHNSAIPSLSFSVTNTDCWVDTLLRTDFDFLLWNETVTYPANHGGYSEYEVDNTDYTVYKATGGTLDYPSEYALASNYVSRLRVYACIMSGEMTTVETIRYDTFVSSSANINYPWFYDSFNYSNSLLNAISDKDDGGSGFPPSGDISPKYRITASSDYPPARYKLIELVDVDNPTSFPEFEIGGLFSDYDFDMTDENDFAFTIAECGIFLPNVTCDRTREKYLHQNTIKVKHYVVITDWAFTYPND